MASEKEAALLRRKLTRLKLAQYFHVLPSELEKVPETELEEWAVLISVLNEVEGERYGK